MRELTEIGRRGRGWIATVATLMALVVMFGFERLHAQRAARATDQPFGMPEGVERTDWKTWLHLNRERYRRTERVDLRAGGLTAVLNAGRDPVAERVATGIARAAASRNPLVRGQAVYALGLREGRMTAEDRRLIDRALDASNPAVRNRAILAAGLSRKPEAIPGLVAILRDRAPEEGVTSEVNDRQQGLAAIALSLIGGDKAIEALARAARSPRKPRAARSAAIAALGYAAHRQASDQAAAGARDVLKRVVGDKKERDDLRSLALIALARWGGSEAAEAVAVMAGQSTVMIRRAAMFATGALVEADERLARAAGNAPPAVPPALVTAVKAGIDDASIPVRTGALLAYAAMANRLDGAPGKVLQAHLDDENVEVRTYAAIALGHAIQRLDRTKRDAPIEALRRTKPANLDHGAALDVARAIAAVTDRPRIAGEGDIRVGTYAALAYACSGTNARGLTDDDIALLTRVRTRVDRHNVVAGLATVRPSREDVVRLRPAPTGKRNSPEVANRLAVLAMWHDATGVKHASALVADEKFPVVDRVLLIEALAQAYFAGAADPMGRLSEWHDPALNFATLDYLLALKW